MSEDRHNIVPELAAHATPIDEVKPHPDNPRRGDVDFIAQLLMEHGQYQVAVADSEGFLAVGNHRWRAAKALGWTHFAVIRRELDPEQARLLRIADNRSHDRGGYDAALLAQELQALPSLEGTGFDQLALEQLLQDVEPPAPPAPPPAPQQFPGVDPDSLEPEFECPDCGYGWRGNPRPGASA